MKKAADRLRSLLAELRRRRVYQVAAVYVAGAFVLLQAAELVMPVLLPEWTYALLVLLVVLGFPVALALGWVFELGPDGIRRTADVGAETRGERGAGLVVRLALALFVVALSAAGGWVAWGHYVASDTVGGPAPSEATLHSNLDPLRLAVLYFDDHTPRGELRHLADGLTEELIHELALVDALDVISRNGVKPVRDGLLTADSLIRALRVGTYVEGSIARSGERLRVTAQLIDASTGVPLSSHSLERPMGELFALQDSLVAEVSESLRRRLGVEVHARAERAETESVVAWTLVQRADRVVEELPDLWARDTAAGLRALDRADSLLARAQTLDPGWPETSLRRGWLSRTRARYEATVPGRAAEASLREGVEHAERVLARFPERPEALELRGTLRADLAGELSAGAEQARVRAAAEADLRRALDRDSSRARAWWTLSDVVRQDGRFAESIRYAERAMEEDPFLADAHLIVQQLFETSFELEDLDRARYWCRDGRRRFPARPDFVLCELLFVASVPTVEPDVPLARALADTVVLLVPAADTSAWRSYTEMQVAKTFARAGRGDSARAAIARAHGDDLQLWLAYDEAHARLLLGEREKALDLLARYLELRPDRTEYWPRDWWLRDLWDDPAFLQLVGDPGSG